MQNLLQRYKRSINPPYNKKNYIMLGLTIFVLLVIPLTIIVTQHKLNTYSQAATLPGNFVTACSTQLCLNGQQFHIHGATAYGQYANATNEATLARQAGINVLELVEFDTQYHVLSDTESTATWTRVDNFIAAAQQAGLHVILNLSEYGQSLAASGQIPTTVDWGPYLSFIANRVNTVTGVKYANDPTIAMVELYGEIDAPNYGKATAGTTAEMTSFYQRSLSEWKILAPNILVSTGGFSYLNDPNSGINWKTIMADPNNATCDMEINSSPDRNNSMPNVSSYCQGLGKPWFLAAWSACYNTNSWGTADINDWTSDASMSAHAQDMYNIDYNKNPTAPRPAMESLGSDFWNLAATQVVNGTCDIGPQFPLSFAVVQNNASTLTPTSAPTVLPTITPIPTNTPTPTQTPTPTPTLIPTPFSTSTPVPNPTPSILSLTNLHVYDSNSFNWHLMTNLQVGSIQWGDRNYSFTNIPSSLVGASWIQTAMNSKTSSTNPLARFTINRSATVYVALDTRNPLPSFMSNWNLTALTLKDNSNLNFRVYSKYFMVTTVPLTIVLGPEAVSSNSHSMYTVIVK